MPVPPPIPQNTTAVYSVSAYVLAAAHEAVAAVVFVFLYLVVVKTGFTVQVLKVILEDAELVISV